MALGCALTIWLLGLFAASAGLHGALHQDAGHAGHACGVTLFNHGVDEAGTPLAAVFTPLLLLDETVSRPAERMVAAPRYRLLPGRAPPAC